MSAHSLDPEAQEIYRDRWLLVLDKPAGLASQAGRDGGPSLYDAVRAREPYAALHHRLDTPASGLILLALDREANPALAEGFRERTISRVYLAAALGDPGEQGRWAEALDGRPAATRWSCAWRPAAPTRSAATRRGRGTRCWAIGATAAPRGGPGRGWRCTPGG